ncbi:hypothetical protein B0H19DRAFT_1070555 [Mycena capillaripes]|nr:hypothetical protein B0H19DRAFT_1070555 [Mycena capillaripes]
MEPLALFPVVACNAARFKVAPLWMTTPLSILAVPLLWNRLLISVGLGSRAFTRASLRNWFMPPGASRQTSMGIAPGSGGVTSERESQHALVEISGLSANAPTPLPRNENKSDSTL